MAQVKITKREDEPKEPVAPSFLHPDVDVYENDAELLLVADLPGVSRDKLTIEVDADQLIIEGERWDKKKKEEGETIAREYRPLDFRRRFALPEGIDIDKITAQLASGILTVHLPKSAGLRPRRVEVKTLS